MDFNVLWQVADHARSQQRLASNDLAFLRDVVPLDLASFPRVNLPKVIKHPAGFSISGAPVGTFLRSALLIAGRKALGNRYGGSPFYEVVERDLAFGIMRSHFHHGYPKGTHCCVQCTLAVYPAFGGWSDSVLRLCSSGCEPTGTHSTRRLEVHEASQREIDPRYQRIVPQ